MTGLLVAVEQAVPFAGDPTPLTGRALVAAVFVVGLLALAAWMLRRRLPSGRGRSTLAIETALALGERRSLVIVAVEGRRLLLGLAPNQVALVTELAPPPPTAFGAALDAHVDGRSGS